MIKALLIGSVFAATLGAGSAFAQDRVINVWGHGLIVSEATATPSLTAEAAARPMTRETITLRHVASAQRDAR
jgi:hypothetical protein